MVGYPQYEGTSNVCRLVDKNDSHAWSRRGYLKVKPLRTLSRFCERSNSSCLKGGTVGIDKANVNSDDQALVMVQCRAATPTAFGKCAANLCEPQKLCLQAMHALSTDKALTYELVSSSPTLTCKPKMLARCLVVVRYIAVLLLEGISSALEARECLIPNRDPRISLSSPLTSTVPTGTPNFEKRHTKREGLATAGLGI